MRLCSIWFISICDACMCEIKYIDIKKADINCFKKKKNIYDYVKI